MSSQANETLRLAKSLIAALTRRDSDAILSHLHEKVVLEAPYPIMPGENITGSRRCEGQSVYDYVHAVNKTVAQVEFKNVIWRTTDDGLALLEADGDLKYNDGRPYQNHYLMMFEAAEGKIIRWREYFSPVIWARASGTPLDSLP